MRGPSELVDATASAGMKIPGTAVALPEGPHPNLGASDLIMEIRGTWKRLTGVISFILTYRFSQCSPVG